MLPGPFLAVLWVAVAWALPAAQSLRALRLKSPERTVWLFYWLCYATCLWIPCYVEGVIRLPFYVLGTVLVDVYHEARLAVVFYLVCPRWRGLVRLRRELGAAAPRLLSRALGPALGDALLATLKGGPARREDGQLGPGVYTIIKEAGVMPTFATLKGSVVHHLKVGETVEVLEVVRNAEEQRLRARIAPSGDRPAGWISLHSEKTGTWWVERGARPLGLLGGSSASEVFAHASAAGCNLAALWTGGAGALDRAEVPDEDAWEAMAMLESQLSRADDPSDAGAMAAGMLKQMLTGVVQMDNPDALGGVQAMVPELGKIWANQSTKAYLRELLAAQRQDGGFLVAQQHGTAGGASAGSSGGSGAPNSGAPGAAASGGSGSASASGCAAGGSRGPSGVAAEAASAGGGGSSAGLAASSGSASGAASGSASGSIEREAEPSGSASGSGAGGAPGAAAGGAS